jgi:peptidyl-prolyl cis-trans isomerase SurA
MMKAILTGLLICILAIADGYSQARIIDRIVAVVGEFHILQSDIESMYLQNKAQGITSRGDMKCEILEEHLSQKLMVNQAKIDSIEVSESTVEMQLDSRLQYFTSMIGSVDALEQYFNKSIIEIKEDMRESVREQMITQQMQGTITADVAITPSEIRDYYQSLERDSIPFINSKVEISQILLYPPEDEEAIFEVKQRLLDLRRRILDGEKFTTLAVLYSEGPTAPDGGDLGYFGRAEMDPAFTKAAFSLKVGGVSTIVESAFGYHLIQLVDRREDQVHARHILMRPRANPQNLRNTKLRLDSIVNEINKDSLTFELAARMFSEDKHTAVNGGVMVNPVDNTTQFELDQLKTEEYAALRDLQVGDITEPFESQDENRKKIYKVIKIRSQSEPHRATIRDDYMILMEMALADKKGRIFREWLDEKMAETYIRVDEAFAGCQFSNKGWLKN